MSCGLFNKDIIELETWRFLCKKKLHSFGVTPGREYRVYGLNFNQKHKKRGYKRALSYSYTFIMRYNSGLLGLSTILSTSKITNTQTVQEFLAHISQKSYEQPNKHVLFVYSTGCVFRNIDSGDVENKWKIQVSI